MYRRNKNKVIKLRSTCNVIIAIHNCSELKKNAGHHFVFLFTAPGICDHRKRKKQMFSFKFALETEQPC